MSTLPENELDLDKLFLPAWAQEPPSAKHYAQYEGGEERPERRGDRRGGKPFRRDGGPSRPREGGPRGERRGQPRRPGDKPSFDRPRPGPGFRREERREPPAPLPQINLAFIPDERGVESLARQIKTTGRAYPLFDIARLILQKPERYGITFSIRKKPDGQPIQSLFTCALDDSLWLSEDDAVSHVLRHHFDTFYQTERTATEPPKGKYTFVAQCGMSGIILGPPNYHDYQNQLRKLHAERFSRMPFEAFKARVKIVRDEEVVKKWTDDQSWKTEFICLNMPESLRLPSREAVEQHFREFHKSNIIKPVESHSLNGGTARSLRSQDLARLVRQTAEDQKRFPLQIATVLSQQFASHGLQFFKVNRAITHVCVARPHFLDLETTPVSDGVKRIVDYINAHPRSTRRKLIESLAPAPPRPLPLPVQIAETPEPPPPAEGAVPEAAPKPAPAIEPPEPTAEQTAVNADLHWLIHQGHVIEFANGILETAKKPIPKPPKPEPKSTEPQPSAPPAPDAASTEPPVPASPEIEPAAQSEPAPATAPVETQAEPVPEVEPPVPSPSTPAESHC